MTKPLRISLSCFVLLLIVGCGGQMNLKNLDARQLFDIGLEKLEQKKYLTAIDAFQKIVFNYKGESMVDSAQYYLATAYFGQKDYTLAQVEYNRLVLNYPSSAFFGEAQFMKAVCFFEGTPDDYALDQTQLTTAIQQFEDFIIDYPESDVVPQAREYIARARHRLARKYYEAGIVYLNIRARSSARIYFQQVVDNFTDSEYAPGAQYYLADIAFKLKEYDKAAEKFANFAAVFPEHEWVAKARQREEESFFRAAVGAVEREEHADARDKFELFKARFPESNKIEKADEYLLKIDAIPVAASDNSNAGS